MSQPGSGVDITVGTDQYWNVGTFTVQEESTPVDPSDSSGAYGQITVDVRDDSNVKFYGGKTISLTDGAQGKTMGIVRGASGNGLRATISADSRLSLLAVNRRALPFRGNLRDALLYYFGLCGITQDVSIDERYAGVQVALPGWSANVYDQVKQMGAAYGFEMSLVSNKIVIRPPRLRVAENYRDASIQWTNNEQQLAQSVEGKWYNSVWRENVLVYPPGGWNSDVTVYTVDAGDTVEVDLEISASLVSVQQPKCVASVSRTHSSSSVYSVTGNDGLPIPPSQWIGDGGSVTVSISEDTRALKLVIKGAMSEQYAPYSIAMASGTSDSYSSLRIVGTGVLMSEETLTLPACLDIDRAPDEVGQVIENEFFQTKDQLYHALLWAAAGFASARRTITVTSKGINRKGDSGSYEYPTIADVNALYPGATIDSIHASLGPTIATWNEKLFASVQDDFVNQAFGNVAGARVLYDDSWYRIRSATITPSSVQYTAEQDNTIADVYHRGETIAEWNARWAGKTINDVNIAPLWEPAPPIAGFGSGGFGEGLFGNS